VRERFSSSSFVVVIDGFVEWWWCHRRRRKCVYKCFEDSLYVLLGDSTTTIPTTIPTEARRIRNRP
jgi:hypothetical protein